ncbi:bifunctional diaminohydroxyphosphoribosylaminopyrimidine deaminase/5-amino-6-(5-phosphoribosylamino)uracil reductase RibD [Paenibacillus sp. J22TS3]|uniref:bifunctional diaminohydroxyphosphoribosylaminopyrimidine deaminase/5-amino-6-(5-phosphoribosylamino)uracil reductase RibD n=1 Tax=Paenibacillus sp. J22TS3 TaxID=2807192 RepID=UPI001B292091|nr:bifunctional diaminohydroxyphosphoribosylaminopyrimidine deaminase/5-amino-6-(5-phosphoribosylamino)uracil reductase RibD [Paenibacillus sp. J22TS3]GIP20160.1 riboflavin biosynthesis protein RibD [Paenibacillus sp. J22TS3]
MERMNDEFYMSLALDMAEKALGQTGSNPVVGAVVVKDGAIVGIGTHLKQGTAHAEVHALNMAGEQAKGSTVYVTLEPCSHYGLTPPCSRRLITEQVARVVIACEDPNPKVAGSGTLMLRTHGIKVDVGVLEDRAKRLNKKFIKFITTGLPFVTLKSASTLDGKIASRSGDSKWITNALAREYVHVLRHQHRGIMVGVETVIADDPELTTRLSVPGLSPVRIIVDSRLRTPEHAKVVKANPENTLFLTTKLADPGRKKAFEDAGIRVFECGEGPQVDLRAAMKMLADAGISSILAEGGGRLNGSLITERLVDEVYMFMAPKLIGGTTSPGNFSFEGPELMKDAVKLDGISVEILEDNVLITGTPVWSDS